MTTRESSPDYTFENLREYRAQQSCARNDLWLTENIELSEILIRGVRALEI